MAALQLPAQKRRCHCVFIVFFFILCMDGYQCSFTFPRYTKTVYTNGFSCLVGFHFFYLFVCLPKRQSIQIISPLEIRTGEETLSFFNSKVKPIIQDTNLYTIPPKFIFNLIYLPALRHLRQLFQALDMYFWKCHFQNYIMIGMQFNISLFF